MAHTPGHKSKSSSLRKPGTTPPTPAIFNTSKITRPNPVRLPENKPQKPPVVIVKKKNKTQNRYNPKQEPLTTKQKQARRMTGMDQVDMPRPKTPKLSPVSAAMNKRTEAEIKIATTPSKPAVAVPKKETVVKKTAPKSSSKKPKMTSAQTIGYRQTQMDDPVKSPRPKGSSIAKSISNAWSKVTSVLSPEGKIPEKKQSTSPPRVIDRDRYNRNQNPLNLRQKQARRTSAGESKIGEAVPANTSEMAQAASLAKSWKHQGGQTKKQHQEKLNALKGRSNKFIGLETKYERTRVSTAKLRQDPKNAPIHTELDTSIKPISKSDRVKSNAVTSTTTSDKSTPKSSSSPVRGTHDIGEISGKMGHKVNVSSATKPKATGPETNRAFKSQSSAKKRSSYISDKKFAVDDWSGETPDLADGGIEDKFGQQMSKWFGSISYHSGVEGTDSWREKKYAKGKRIQ